jgi:superfamily I DNA/RNA helicase
MPASPAPPQLSAEARRIVSSTARRLAVQAGAGTGKSTTLRAYALARPRQRILCLAFNKAIQLEAAAKMPTNVVCRTSHALAYKIARALFGGRVEQRVGKTYPSTVARLLGCSPLAASAALAAIQRWCGSLDEELGMEHLPDHIVARLGEPRVLLQLAQLLWEHMVDPHETDIRLPHDGYLKLYQLQQPMLRDFGVVLVDEAQDLNHCTFDIVSRQDATIVMVGDEAQSINGYRGCVNALRLLDADERLPLMCSWRFGEGIAHMANALLSHFKSEFVHPIVGAGEPRRTRLNVDVARPFAIITRTNAMAFDEAVNFLDMDRSYHFIGGTEGYRLEKILDAYHLWMGERAMVRDPYLKSFPTFAELAELALDAEDAELKQLVRAVERYGGRIPVLIDEITARHVKMHKSAWAQFDGIFIGTTHKTKGLEFDQVWLADDYMRFFEEGRELGPAEVVPEEVNLLYVSLTRARTAVRLPEEFAQWLAHRNLLPW